MIFTNGQISHFLSRYSDSHIMHCQETLTEANTDKFSYTQIGQLGLKVWDTLRTLEAL